MNDGVMLKSGMRGLYLHLPFCAQKCHYCNFVISLDRSKVNRAKFLDALETEMKRSRKKYGPLVFDTVYLGGGTPSLLNEEEMECVFGMVQKYFEIRPEAEITCEFNPGDADAAKIRTFKKLGVNRVSLGVQAFQEPLLRETGRLHSVEDITRTVNWLHEAGLENISFDLIAGLPGQTPADFEFSLNQTVAAGASQLSFYDLEIHDATFWGGEKKKGRLALPAEEKRAEMFDAAVRIMTGAGYVQYEISTFAKPGKESRHNLIYWNNQEYLGLGPGAYSYMDGTRYQWASDLPRYFLKTEKDEKPCDFEEILSPEKREIETLITGLRLQGGVRLEDFPVLQSFLPARISKLAGLGLLETQGARICLTSRGRFLAEQAFSLLIGQ